MRILAVWGERFWKGKMERKFVEEEDFELSNMEI